MTSVFLFAVGAGTDVAVSAVGQSGGQYSDLLELYKHRQFFLLHFLFPFAYFGMVCSAVIVIADFLP